MKPSDDPTSNAVYKAWDYVDCEVCMAYRNGDSVQDIRKKFNMPANIILAILKEANYL